MIEINGEKYIKVSEKADNYYIVRTESAGVFAGELKNGLSTGTEVVVYNARRLWFWAGAASLSQLAMEGVKNPKGCKFPCEVPEVYLTGVIEVLPCTLAAKNSIASVPVWEAEED